MSQSPEVDQKHPITALPQSWPVEDLEAVERCPLCGGTDRTVLYRDLTDGRFCAPGTWALHRCLGCESGYLDPRPTADAIGRAYRSYHTHEALSYIIGLSQSVVCIIQNSRKTQRIGGTSRALVLRHRRMIHWVPISRRS
jgi:hypothetical protein